MEQDYFQAREVLKTAHGNYIFYRLSKLEQAGLTRLDRLFEFQPSDAAALKELGGD